MIEVRKDIFDRFKTIEMLSFTFGERQQLVTLGRTPKWDAARIFVAFGHDEALLSAAFSALASDDQVRAQEAVVSMGDDDFGGLIDSELRDKAAAQRKEAELNRFNPSFRRAVKFGEKTEEVADGFAEGLRRCVGLV